MSVPDLNKIAQLMSSESTMAWLVSLVNIVLIALAAYVAAQLTWRFIPSSEASLAPPQFVATTNVGNKNRAGVDVDRLVSHHLFGKADKSALRKVTDPVVRATRLPLTLRGVIASDRPDTARAIISAPNAGELSYAIGSTLPGNAKLEEIHTHHIILSRNGQLETLLLPNDKEGVDFSVAPMLSPAAENAGIDEVLIATPDQFRDALLDEPESLAGLVNTIPKMNAQGRLIGFQLQPGNDAGFLQRFGLQSGDVLTSVNGIQLNSPVRALEVIRELGEAGQVTVEVLRDDIPQSFVFSFDQG